MIPIRKITLTALAVLSLGIAGCSASTGEDSVNTANSVDASSSAESDTTESITAEEEGGADGSDTPSSSATPATSPSADPTPTESSTPDADIDATADSGPIPVDPQRFAADGPHLFSYTAQNGETGTCLLTPDGATCTGVPAADVPDISHAPFEGQRPGAVSASMGGIHYTILEGVPPAPAQLQPGEKLVVDTTSCEVSPASDVTCVSGDTSFTVSGKDRSISTN